MFATSYCVIQSLFEMVICEINGVKSELSSLFCVYLCHFCYKLLMFCSVSRFMVCTEMLRIILFGLVILSSGIIESQCFEGTHCLHLW